MSSYGSKSRSEFDFSPGSGRTYNRLDYIENEYQLQLAVEEENDCLLRINELNSTITANEMRRVSISERRMLDEHRSRQKNVVLWAVGASLIFGVAVIFGIIGKGFLTVLFGILTLVIVGRFISELISSRLHEKRAVEYAEELVRENNELRQEMLDLQTHRDHLSRMIMKFKSKRS